MKPSKLNSLPPTEVIFEPYSLLKEMKDFLEDLWDAYEYSKEIKAKRRLNDFQKRRIMGIQKVIANAILVYTKTIKDNSEYELNARELVICEDMEKFGEKMMELMNEIDWEYVCGKMHRLHPFIDQRKILVRKTGEC